MTVAVDPPGLGAKVQRYNLVQTTTGTTAIREIGALPFGSTDATGLAADTATWHTSSFGSLGARVSQRSS